MTNHFVQWCTAHPHAVGIVVVLIFVVLLILSIALDKDTKISTISKSPLEVQLSSCKSEKSRIPFTITNKEPGLTILVKPFEGETIDGLSSVAILPGKTFVFTAVIDGEDCKWVYEVKT